MPLLAQDKFGRVYQTEGLSEFDDASVGYYAEMDDTDNLYFGEMGYDEQRRLAALRKARQRQAMLQRRRQKLKLAQARRRKAVLDAQKARQAAIIKQAQDRKRQRENAIRLARIRASRNAFSGYEQTTVGNPLAGWEKGEAITNPKDWAKVNVPHVQKTTEFGISNYHHVEHPLMGFNFGVYDDEFDGTMGFKVKKPKIRISTPRITIPTPRKIVKEVGKVAGTVINAPLKLAHQAVTHIPIVKDVYKGADKLTGGTLTSLHKTVMLPGRALQGKPVSKAEFMESLSNAIKVGAIVVTAGAASSVIGATSSALAKGPLGQTSFGRSLLSIGEIASLSSLGNQSLSVVMEKKAVDKATAHAASEAGKRGGVLGSIAASAAASALAQGAGVGVAQGGKELPLKASPQTAVQTAAIANKAGEQASKSALEAIKTSGLKFDSSAAQEQFVNSAKDQAQREVAKDFQKKTGIPLDVALKVSRGEVPTKQELYDKVKNEFYGTVSDLENRLAQIPSQISNAEPLMKKMLEEKSEMLAKEIADRKNLINKVQTEHAERLAKLNQDLKDKGTTAIMKESVLAEYGKQHEILSQKIKNANLDERGKLGIELAALQEKIMKARAERDAAVDEAEQAARLAEYEKEKGAVLVLQSEYGGPNARQRFLGELDSDNYIHPMLRYGLIERIS